MNGTQNQRVLARPPWDFSCIEDFEDMERLGVIYAKLESITSAFSAYEPNSNLKGETASSVYGYWFILQDICNELADILKLSKW
jgi:hypothetical protein